VNQLWQFLALLAVHWVADFVLQTHWQASNKSKNNGALSLHVTVYTWCLGVGAVLIFPISSPTFLFALVNGALHFITDFCTSRVSSRLFMAQFNEFDIVLPSLIHWPDEPAPTERRLFMKKDFNPHNFFVVIGLDQLIHQATLAVTMWAFLT
jgi:hypothetical protein